MAAPYSKIRTSPSCRDAHWRPPRHRLCKCQVREENVALREMFHPVERFCKCVRRSVTHLKGCASCCWNFKMRGRATLAPMRPSLASPGNGVPGSKLQRTRHSTCSQEPSEGPTLSVSPWTKWLTSLARRSSGWLSEQKWVKHVNVTRHQEGATKMPCYQEARSRGRNRRQSPMRKDVPFRDTVRDWDTGFFPSGGRSKRLALPERPAIAPKCQPPGANDLPLHAEASFVAPNTVLTTCL